MNYADEPSQAALERASQDVYDVIASQQGVCVDQGCSGARTRSTAVTANILQPERLFGKYHWPQVEL